MMRTTLFLTIFLLTIVFVSCQNSYTFWDISRFNMDSLALKDNDPIKLLYTSRGPDNNKDRSYYIHIIAVSQNSGDTVNILTTADNGFTAADEGKIFNFFDQNNLITKISQSDHENLADPNKINELQKTELKKISKVVRDPNFDHIADNKYPTVIGSIGTVKAPE